MRETVGPRVFSSIREYPVFPLWGFRPIYPYCIFARYRKDLRLHLREKPVLVIAALIAANVSDMILDPFMGSGTAPAGSKRLRPRSNRHRNRRKILREATRLMSELSSESRVKGGWGRMMYQSNSHFVRIAIVIAVMLLMLPARSTSANDYGN